MNDTLVSACLMFLVPATLLFGAHGVANGRGMKLLVCLLGLGVAGLWLYRIWLWSGLSLADRHTALGLAGLYAAAWLVTLLAQLKALVAPGDARR
ncbi:MAG: hypothetical protein ACLP1D_29055 [Xanthobacteraceae bacterium]